MFNLIYWQTSTLTFSSSFTYSAVIECSFHADAIPEMFVSGQFFVGKGRFFKNCQSFRDFRSLEQFFQDDTGRFIYLRQETKPKDVHTLLAISMRSEFGQFDKDQLQVVDDMIRVFDMPIA